MPRWSATTGSETTVAPGCGLTAPGPASSTSAANSWPITRSRPASNVNRDDASPAEATASLVISTIRSACWAAWRSDPQIPHAFVCTSTWPSPGTGSATSSTTICPPRRIAAFISTAASFRLLLHFNCCFISTAVSFRLLVFGVLLDGLHDRRAGATHELGAVGDRPIAGLDQRAGRVLEGRHHLGGEELVGAQCRLGIGPVVGEQEVRAEAPRLLGEPLQLDDGLFGRADDGEAVVDQGVDDGVRPFDTFGREWESGHPAEVVDPQLDAVAHLLARLLLRGRQVHRADKAPRIAIDAGIELRGPLLHDLPVLSEHVEALHDGGAERQQTAPEASGGARPGGGDRRRHRHVEVRLRVGAQL